MYAIRLNCCVRYRVFVWMVLSILACVWVPTVSVAQQSEASGPGTLLWKFEFGGFFPHHYIGPRSGVIVGERLYFGGFDGNFYAVNKHTGQEYWRLHTGDGRKESITTSPTVADGVAYFGSKDHHLYAVDLETGQERWRFETQKEIRSTPAVADGVVTQEQLDQITAGPRGDFGPGRFPGRGGFDGPRGGFGGFGWK